MRGEVVLQTQSPSGWLRFTNPIEIVAATTLDEVLPALRRVEELVTTRSAYAAGFIAYEAAPAFDPDFARARCGIAAAAVVWPV